jgi:tripartite-type tricarboxylate transporter receptor subunit TctC
VQLHRRALLRLAAGAAAVPTSSRIARAQGFPSRPVRIVVGFSPGGTLDIVARLIGQRLSEQLGQQFVIENRGGAGGSLGAEVVVRAPPDGSTLLLCNSGDLVNETIYDKKLSFNFLRDVAPVASIANGPLVLVVHPSVPAMTIPEFIAHIKANRSEVSFGSAGIGTVPHMAGELFKAMAGVDLLHVPYRGLAPALNDLLGGQVQAVFSSIPPAVEHIRAGKLRAVAVTSTVRSETLPDVPTVGVFLPGYEATLMVGIGAPKDTPAEIVERLSKEINAALADPSVKARFADLGLVPLSMTSAEFGNFIANETEKWGRVIRAANIKAG